MNSCILAVNMLARTTLFYKRRLHVLQSLLVYINSCILAATVAFDYNEQLHSFNYTYTVINYKLCIHNHLRFTFVFQHRIHQMAGQDFATRTAFFLSIFAVPLPISCSRLIPHLTGRKVCMRITFYNIGDSIVVLFLSDNLRNQLLFVPHVVFHITIMVCSSCSISHNNYCLFLM